MAGARIRIPADSQLRSRRATNGASRSSATARRSTSQLTYSLRRDIDTTGREPARPAGHTLASSSRSASRAERGIAGRGVARRGADHGDARRDCAIADARVREHARRADGVRTSGRDARRIGRGADTADHRLPVFRSHITEASLASDAAEMNVMADELPAAAQRAIHDRHNRRGAWLANPGWPGGEVVRPSPTASATPWPAVASHANASIGGALFLIVSEPARFAEEVLGTMTVGFRIDDGVAADLAEVAHVEVNLVVGDRLAASSLRGEPRAALECPRSAAPPLRDLAGPGVGARGDGRPPLFRRGTFRWPPRAIAAPRAPGAAAGLGADPAVPRTSCSDSCSCRRRHLRVRAGRRAGVQPPPDAGR